MQPQVVGICHLRTVGVSLAYRSGRAQLHEEMLAVRTNRRHYPAVDQACSAGEAPLRR